MKEQYVEDETQATPEESTGAPAATDEAASESTGAPAQGPPEGYIEQDRYENLRKEFNQRNSLIDRAKSGDNDALRELIGAEFAQDEEEVPAQGDGYQDEQYVDPVAREWIQQQEVEKNLSAFNAHLDRLAGDPNLLDEFDRQALLQKSLASGFNEKATEEAFDAWKKREDARQKKAVDDYIKSKRAPHVSAVGTGATETPFRDDMSTRELTKAAVEQFRLAKEQ
jgi:hypothetical protein